MNFPKSKQYNEEWVNKNLMGPNALWLVELLSEKLHLKPGMKVLDLGCGTALTSIFLAKEFGVTVFACDLWISPADNLERIKKMGVEDLVFPLEAEAHSLPFAEEFFDVVVSVDAYHYFGTNEMYLPMFFYPLLKKGGQFGIACPSLSREFDHGVPETLKPFWTPEMYTLHSAEWWKNLWAKTGLVKIKHCVTIEQSAEIWDSWLNCGNEYAEEDKGLIAADVDKYITLMMMTAKKK